MSLDIEKCHNKENRANLNFTFYIELSTDTFIYGERSIILLLISHSRSSVIILIRHTKRLLTQHVKIQINIQSLSLAIVFLILIFIPQPITQKDESTFSLKVEVHNDDERKRLHTAVCDDESSRILESVGVDIMFTCQSPNHT